MAGRKPLLTDQAKETIKKALEDGNYDIVAYTRAGISKSTFYSWLKKGEDAQLKKDGTPYARDAQYVEFLDMVTRARVEGEAHHVENWKEKGKDDWRASAEFLARKYPERWGRQDRVDITTQQEKVTGITWILKSGKEEDATDAAG